MMAIESVLKQLSIFRFPTARRSCQRGCMVGYHWTPKSDARFVAVLADCGSVRIAARAVGMSPKSAYARRKRDAGFAARWYAALDAARAPLLDRLMEAAMTGVVHTGVRTADGRLYWHHADRALGRGRGMAQLRRLDRMLTARDSDNALYVTFGANPPVSEARS